MHLMPQVSELGKNRTPMGADRTRAYQQESRISRSDHPHIHSIIVTKSN